ncbi:hypothetical protein M8J75_006824 [Diaphorina citri]|nr:hypothetical protein M8J75_006824 [Diaphorina citri]
MMVLSVILVSIILGLTLDVHANHVDFLSDEYIDSLNKQGLSWTAGRNFAADLTPADVERMFGPRPPHQGFPEYPAPSERRSYYRSGLNAAPSFPPFDAREHFKSCAPIISAFAISSVASDRLCIASQGKVKKLLSAQYIASCCKMCRYPNQKEICSSGLSSSTWVWVHKRGLVTGGAHHSNTGCQPVSFPPCNHANYTTSEPECKTLATPQPKCHTRCTNDNYGRGFFQDKYRFKRYYWVNDEVADIQQEIMKNGPVVANMYLYSDIFSYKSGVYAVSASAEIVAYATVKIIGWGEENGRPYWTIVSTFGEQFGDKGTIKILRGHNEAIIESLVNGALPKDNYGAEFGEASGEILSEEFGVGAESSEEFREESGEEE